MALGGAWVRTSLGANFIVFEGRTFGADNDTAVLGLDGDVGADTGFTTPAAFPTTGETAPTDALRNIRTRIRVIPLSDHGSAAAGPAVGFSVEQGVTPWRATIRMNGAPAAAVTVRVEVEYIHSLIR